MGYSFMDAVVDVWPIYISMAILLCTRTINSHMYLRTMQVIGIWDGLSVKV